MDPIQEIAILGRPDFEAQGIKPRDGGTPTELGALIWTGAKDRLRAFAAEAEAIQADPDLTKEGKAKRVATLGETQLKALERFVPGVNKLRGKVATAVNKLQPKSAFEDEVARAIWLTKMIDLLPADALRVDQIYTTALETGDSAVMEAVEALPSLHAGRLDPGRLSELRQQRVRAQDPEGAQRLQELEDATALADNALRNTADAIRERAGIQTADVVQLRDGDGGAPSAETG